MSSIHGVWSCGLLGTSAVAAGAAALGTSPLQHFGLVALALAPASAPVVHGMIDDREDGAPASPSGGDRAVRWAAVVPLGVIGFCSFLGEGAMHDWAAVYLRDRLGTSPGTAALGFTGFALGMTVSRFVADDLTTRFGPVAVVRVAGLAAAGGLAMGLLVATPAAAIAGFTVLGASLAPVVPTVFSAAGNVDGVSGATSLGWVVTLSYVGGILGPALIGFTARAAGLRLALGIAALLALVISALAGRVGAARRALPVGAPPVPSEGPW
jgi:fucose permease